MTQPTLCSTHTTVGTNNSEEGCTDTVNINGLIVLSPYKSNTVPKVVISAVNRITQDMFKWAHFMQPRPHLICSYLLSRSK